LTLIGISFQSVHYHTLLSSWKSADLHSLDSMQQTENSHLMMKWGCQPYTGGTFVIYDWEKNRVIWQIDIDRPAGFCWHNDLLYIIMLRLNEIVALDNKGREQYRISHSYFNDLHSIKPTKRGFLLTSTGVDSILEIDKRGNIHYHWCAIDHGYERMKNGNVRMIDFTQDQRYYIYRTQSHTTHVNSALFADDKEELILATLFQQGTIIAINRRSDEVRTLMSGLKYPHDLRPYPSEGWIVSDTRGSQTLIIDKQWNITQRITMNFEWVNSSALLSDGSLVISDADHFRLVRVFPDSQRAPEICTFPPEWAAYYVEEVPSAYNKLFL
jgi:hypothetical protein